MTPPTECPVCYGLKLEVFDDTTVYDGHRPCPNVTMIGHYHNGCYEMGTPRKTLTLRCTDCGHLMQFSDPKEGQDARATEGLRDTGDVPKLQGALEAQG